MREVREKFPTPEFLLKLQSSHIYKDMYAEQT
jgi:hypothetical protein